MHLFRHFILIACPALLGALLLVGCSQPQPEVARLAPSSPPVAAPATPAPEPAPADKVGPSAEATPPIQGPPTPESAPAEKLPEVLAVNTAQLGGLVEKTLGKVTVLNIWATWCGPCVFEIPEIVKFYNEMDTNTTTFLSLSLDEEADITAAIPKFQREHQVPFPIYVLNERNDEGLLKALRGKFSGGIPTTIIYDREGKIAKKLEGAITLDELVAIVKPLRGTNP